MKQGRDLVQLAQEVTRQADLKRDFIANTTALRMVPVADGERAALHLEVRNSGRFEINRHAHNQLGERLQIPAKYYDRMQQEAPDLLAQNVNVWFQKKPEKRMVRTMTLERPSVLGATGIARAILSDRYRRLDNFDMMQAALPFIMQEYGRPLTVVSSEVTEQKLYLKVVAPHTERDINTLLKPGTHMRVNEPVRSGFILQNSEIGMGSISAFPFVEMLRCTNGLIVTEFGHRRYHTGKRVGGDGDVGELEQILSDETRQLDDAAFWSKTKDIIRACLDEARVTAIFRRMAEARELPIEAPPEQAVEVLANNHGLNETERGGVLRALIDSGLGLNAYGMANAINTVAGTVDSYDRATALEELAGKVITLSPNDWKAVSTAASKALKN